MSNLTRVELALLLDECCNNFRIGFGANEALRFAAQASNYNQCTQQVMFDLIECINSMIPKMKYPGNNPNNGKPFHTIYIGQTPGGRIIGVEFDRLQLEGENGYTWDDCLALGDRIAELKDQVQAGDVIVTERLKGLCLHIRFWWD